MKSTLTFDLDDLDDQHSHRQCLQGKNMALALYSFQQWIIHVMEHEQLSPERYEQMEKVKDTFSSYLEKYSIVIDDLIY